MKVQITNPRLSARADVTLEGGQVVEVNFDRDDSELMVIERIKRRVAEMSAVSVADGGPAIPVPSDESLAPVLTVLRRMQGEIKDVG